MALGSVVVCLGEALIDRLGPPGGDPAVDRPVDDRLGGAPANVASGLARLETPVAFAGRLGQDAIGEAFSRLFAERGVDTLLLQRDAERPSRIVLVRRSLEGERQFQGFAGDQGAGFADQALEPFVLPEARCLLIGTLPLAAPTSASALLSAVRQARNQEAQRPLRGWWTGIPAFFGFEVRDHDFAWKVFFYRFVDPLARSGAGANYAERLRGASARILPGRTGVVYRAPLQSGAVSDR